MAYLTRYWLQDLKLPEATKTSRCKLSRLRWTLVGSVCIRNMSSGNAPPLLYRVTGPWEPQLVEKYHRTYSRASIRAGSDLRTKLKYVN